MSEPAPRTEPVMGVDPLIDELRGLGDRADAEFLQRFFRTGPGEYAEGDRFLGVRVPVLRRLSRKYATLPLAVTLGLLRSPFHEARLLALFILARCFERGDRELRTAIFRAYLANTHHVNNWDLVDASAHVIVGAYLDGADDAPLLELAASSVLWERRIAIVATLHFIRQHRFDPTLRVARVLIDDHHDLIQKAVGWMLREVGRRDRRVLEEFLLSRYRTMPRTMLRYAIERLPPDLRERYLRRTG